MDLNDLLKNPEQVQGLISLLQGILDNKAAQDQTTNKVSKKPVQNKVIKNKSMKKQTESKINRFDKMKESKMHKQDSEIDKKLSVMPPVAREREFDMMNVQCRICGKKEEVHPILVPDGVNRYKCNSCSTEAS